MKYHSLAIALFLISAVLGAQESIDDLFDDPGTGIIEEEPEETVDIEALTSQETVTFSGSVSAEAGISAGLRSWDNSQTIQDRLDVAAFYAMSSRVRLDARPTSASRFYAAVSAAAPATGSVTFDGISLDEIFLDYTLRDTAVFRVGKYSMTWGNGQLFNPANLVSPVSGAMTLRGFVPVRSGGLTLVAIAKNGFFTDPDLPGIAEVGYAGLLEWNRSPLSGSFGGYYQEAAGPRTSAAVKFPVSGVDVSLEGVVDWADNPEDNVYDALLATFWEGTDIGLQLVAEYLFESDKLPNGLGSTFGVGVLATDLLPRWNPGVRWFHALHDGSGEVILGADGPIADDMRMSIGMPISYGAPGTTYREETEDPAGRVISTILRFSLSFSF